MGTERIKPKDKNELKKDTVKNTTTIEVHRDGIAIE